MVYLVLKNVSAVKIIMRVNGVRGSDSNLLTFLSVVKSTKIVYFCSY